MTAERALASWENEGGRVTQQSPDTANPSSSGDAAAHSSNRLISILTLIIQAWLVVGLIIFIIRGDIENIFLTALVIALIVIPAFVLQRYRVHVPPEFQLIAAAFVFLTLFLGSAGDFYYHFWWWDMVLHAGSGFLLGIVGWIVLFLLLQTDRLPRAVGPALVCVFAITFAVTLGVLWEIFEYVVDLLWPNVNMICRETGIHDTIHDLIVNTIGAIIVGLMGYAYSRSGRFSFLIDAVRAFMRKNPRWFGGKRTGAH